MDPGSVNSLPVLDMSFLSNIHPVQFVLFTVMMIFIITCICEAALHLIFETIRFAETAFDKLSLGKNSALKEVEKL